MPSCDEPTNRKKHRPFLKALKQPQTCLTDSQVSSEFREAFIKRGYRHANKPFYYYLKSMCFLNNETINFWSHFVPFLFVVCYIFWKYLDEKEFDEAFFIYLVTVALYLVLSSFAHMFNSMSSTARHMCFILDYMGRFFNNLPITEP